jgi:hypothetical protein
VSNLTTEKYRVLKGYIGFPGNIYGGPFPYLATAAKGSETPSLTVKLDPRCNIVPDVDLPIQDFQLPASEREVMKAFRRIFSALSRGHSVYIGCTAGWGRTGTIMASLVNVARPNVDPVAFVREHYDSHAVETAAQAEYARTFAKRHPWFSAWVRFWYSSAA